MISLWLVRHPWSVGWTGAIVYAELLWVVYH